MWFVESLPLFKKRNYNCQNRAILQSTRVFTVGRIIQACAVFRFSVKISTITSSTYKKHGVKYGNMYTGNPLWISRGS